MKVQEIIDRLLAYYPDITGKIEKFYPGVVNPATADSIKCGDPMVECTGIATAIYPSIDIIRRAIALGCNFLIVHEPSFYTHPDSTDWLRGKSEVFDAKWKLLEDAGIVIYRDHDHIHNRRPDGIMYGVAKELDWLPYLVNDYDWDSPDLNLPQFVLPETTVYEIAKHLKQKLQMKAVRVIGNVNACVSKVSFAAHICPSVNEERVKALEKTFENGTEVLIPGEMWDWSPAAYYRDAGQLGLNKAIIQVGHFSMEELGMKYAAEYIDELLNHSVPIHFLHNGDMYDYVF